VDLRLRPSKASDTGLAFLFWSLLACIGFAAVLVGAIFLLSDRARQDNAWIRRSLAIRDQANQAVILAQRAETSQRGYLLTGRDAYLAPYSGAAAALPATLDQLTAHVIDDPSQRETVDRLRQVSVEKLAELQSTIDAKKAGNSDLALSIVKNDFGLHMMNEIGALVGDIQSEEDRDGTTRRKSYERLSSLVEIGSALAFAALIAIGVLFSVLTRRSFREITTTSDRLATTNEALINQIVEREKVESQLRQSQKMEAIGQLTGGIAHDFNNMLAVIAGNLDILHRRLDRGETNLTRFVDSAMQGAQRAAALTQRLLAFSRQQALSPEFVEPNRMIASMSDLLRSTLGEHIRIETVLAAGLWTTKVDPHQLENAILNIALNARDAMPDGGKLTIETANAYLDEAYCRMHEEVKPGQYILIAISDTGVGMPPHVAARAFDPFFTTKPAGEGTGLGLSQAFGFIKQSKGHINLYSEVGAGTSAKIYLPRLVETVRDAKPQSVPKLPRGSTEERILIVEDDTSVRQIAAEAVRELGYAVFESDSATEALKILEVEDIHLLMTDIVMPEVNGKKLADEAVRRRPNLKVLFMTGYTRNAVVHGGMVDPGVHLIGKPFTLDQIAAKIRETLAEKP
jgi:signal transduction histidine kinase